MRRRPASRTPSNRSSRPRTRWMRRSSSTQSPPWAVSLSRDREVLQTHRVKADVVSSDWGAGPDIPALREALKTPTKAVAVVHNETSTGITNPLEPIVEAAHAVDAAVLVDAVSSLGGLPLPRSGGPPTPSRERGRRLLRLGRGPRHPGLARGAQDADEGRRGGSQ